MSSIPLFYVYVLARPNGTVFYVGKGSKARVFYHEKEARSACKCHKCNVIRKIWRGGGEVQRYTLLTTHDEEEAFAYERELITQYGRANLCNHTDGGEGVANPSEETRKKISAACSRRTYRRGHHLSEETRRKIGLRHKGKVISQDERDRIRATLTGRKMSLSNEERQARADRIRRFGKPFPKGFTPAHAGKPLSEETRRKISESVKANPASYGRKMSEETRRKFLGARDAYFDTIRRTYQLIDPDGTEYETNNLPQFCRDHGLNYQTLSKVIRNTGRYKKWRIKRVN